MDSMRLKDGTEVGLPGGLIGLDAEGQLWASQMEEPEPLTDGDLVGFLGGPAARLGDAMADQARKVFARAWGQGDRTEPPIRQVGDRLVVPAAQVGEPQLRLYVPHGVLAIGLELDVWRTVGRLLWSPTQASPYTADQAAELALEARDRWRAFEEEQLRLWCPPMATAQGPEATRS